VGIQTGSGAGILAPRRRNHAVWVGLVLTFLGAITYFTYFARFADLRDMPWLNLAVLWIGVMVSIAAVWRAFSRSSPYRGRILGTAGLLLSLVLALLFNLYIFKFSYALPAPTAATLSMTAAPEFTLSDQRGNPVALADYRGRKVVLTYYRGHW
jgi:hypothetical protein